MAAPGITDDLRNRIHAGLLRIDAARGIQKPDWSTECLESAYDLYARELSRAGWPLTEALLTESIPSWVYQWAMERGWLPTTRPVAGVIGNMLEGWMRTDRPVKPIPEADLRAWVRKSLRSRITYWQAEALSPEALSPEANPEAEKPLDLLTRVRTRHTMDAIAYEAGIVRTTLYQWRRAPHSVEPKTAAAIAAALQRLARTLSK